MSDLEYVGMAAVSWNSARVFAERLRDARAMCVCEIAQEGHAPVFDGNFNEVSGYEQRPELPCWKGRGRDHDGLKCYEPIETWCSSCRLRERLHGALRIAVAWRGARMRAIQARARRVKLPEESA